jgi:hypothetical protein
LFFASQFDDAAQSLLMLLLTATSSSEFFVLPLPVSSAPDSSGRVSYFTVRFLQPDSVPVVESPPRPQFSHTPSFSEQIFLPMICMSVSVRFLFMIFVRRAEHAKAFLIPPLRAA